MVAGAFSFGEPNKSAWYRSVPPPAAAANTNIHQYLLLLGWGGVVSPVAGGAGGTRIVCCDSALDTGDGGGLASFWAQLLVTKSRASGALTDDAVVFKVAKFWVIPDSTC